jgi:hypothetical protein
MRDKIWFVYLQILKRWTRSGLYEFLETSLSDVTPDSTILSIGGFGEVDKRVRSLAHNKGSTFLTLDIEASHAPDILGDIHNLSEFLCNRGIKPTHIVAIEVLEHVQSPETAINECSKSLTDSGKLIFSTPWIIPIHDRPHDYWRMTPQAIQLLTKNFSKCEITARGNEIDSVICLMLRGLFSANRYSKFLTFIIAPLTLIMRKPKLTKNLGNINSTIGYAVTCVKQEFAPSQRLN